VVLTKVYVLHLKDGSHLYRAIQGKKILGSGISSTAPVFNEEEKTVETGGLIFKGVSKMVEGDEHDI
jgi:hypothetical protein